MKNFGKLLNWEIVRFSKFYGVLLLLTLFMQLFGVWLYTHNRMQWVQETMSRQSLTASQLAARFGKASLSDGYDSVWLEGSIFLGAVSLLLYVFLIWYKEWFGRSTFAYRLLMLPTSRMNVFLAKLSAIVLFVWALVAFQFILLYAHVALFEALLPSEFRQAVTVTEVIERHPLLRIMLPADFTEFVLYYGAGIMSIIILFTGILLERSFRFKGIAWAVLYVCAVALLFLLPILIAEVWYREYFFPSEVILMEIFAGLLVIGISLKFSSYLLRRKVTV